MVVVGEEEEEEEHEYLWVVENDMSKIEARKVN